MQALLQVMAFCFNKLSRPVIRVQTDPSLFADPVPDFKNPDPDPSLVFAFGYPKVATKFFTTLQKENTQFPNKSSMFNILIWFWRNLTRIGRRIRILSRSESGRRKKCRIRNTANSQLFIE